MIEKQIIDGRSATIAYLDGAMQPASKDAYSYARVLFGDDGNESLLLVKADPGANAMGSHITKRVVGIWRDAIDIIDTSEIELRDLIERRLDGVAASTIKLGPMLRSVNSLLRGVKTLRVQVIKAAFRVIRDQHIRGSFKGLTMAQWASRVATQDVTRIEAVIRSGLVGGLDNMTIARNVVGSAISNGMDGVTEITRQTIAQIGLAAIKGRS